MKTFIYNNQFHIHKDILYNLQAPNKAVSLLTKYDLVL